MSDLVKALSEIDLIVKAYKGGDADALVSFNDLYRIIDAIKYDTPKQQSDCQHPFEKVFHYDGMWVCTLCNKPWGACTDADPIPTPEQQPTSKRYVAVEVVHANKSGSVAVICDDEGYTVDVLQGHYHELPEGWRP